MGVCVKKSFRKSQVTEEIFESLLSFSLCFNPILNKMLFH